MGVGIIGWVSLWVSVWVYHCGVFGGGGGGVLLASGQLMSGDTPCIVVGWLQRSHGTV